jgi:hypothetical protein
MVDLSEARAELDAPRQRASRLELMTEQRVCGLLEISGPTFIKLPIPRIRRSGVIRYRIEDVERFLEDATAETTPSATKWPGLFFWPDTLSSASEADRSTF